MDSVSAKIRRFFLVAQLCVIQIIQRNIVSFKRSWLLSPTTQPNAWRAVTGRNDLYQSRIFKPKVDTTVRLPLVVMVHGGGFLMNNPSVDDPLARRLADACQCLVVSIDYRKLPRFSFPAAYEDIVQSIQGILGDGIQGIRIDMNKVVLFGSSGGGNLVLAAAQDMRLSGKFLGLIALYPVASMLPTAAQQMATRPDPSVPDFLEDKWDRLLDLYAGSRDPEILKDPRLSPNNFTKRSDLPEHAFIIGAEHDLLCHEAKILAERLANATAAEKKELPDGWQAGTVRWKLVKGQIHAFDHFPAKPLEAEEARQRATEDMYADCVRWLQHILTRN